MTRPTAAPAHWPYLDHRTCEEVARNAYATQTSHRAPPGGEPAPRIKPPGVGVFSAVSR